MKAIVTPATSPFTVLFPTDASSAVNNVVHIEVSGTVTIILPAISTLQQTLNQQVVVTNIASNGAATIQPSATNTVSATGTGVAYVAPTGLGNSVILQPVSAVAWNANESGASS